MGLDIRLPIGLLFTLIGALLTAFGILAWRLIPLLLQARVDGKEH